MSDIFSPRAQAEIERANDAIAALRVRLSDTEARLSAAQEETRLWKGHQERTKAIKKDLQTRLFAAEAEADMWRQQSTKHESQLRSFKSANEENYRRRVRAKEVVEAVNELMRLDTVRTRQAVLEAIRHYEEGR